VGCNSESVKAEDKTLSLAKQPRGENFTEYFIENFLVNFVKCTYIDVDTEQQVCKTVNYYPAN